MPGTIECYLTQSCHSFQEVQDAQAFIEHGIKTAGHGQDADQDGA